MKNKTTQILILFLCLAGYHLASAQTDYIVLINGDTLFGNVKYFNYSAGKKIQLINQEKKKTVYSILQVKSFQLDQEVYETIRTTQEYTIMKVIMSGYLSLYSFQLPNQMTWNGSYLHKKDGSGMEVPTIGFKKNLSRLLGDCPAIAERIQTGELTRSEIEQIVVEYNVCINEATKNHTTQPTTTDKDIQVWETLEKEVTDLNFDGKTNALEMISEIKSKISKKEKVPNFLMEGLKEALKGQESVKSTLDKALLEIDR